MLKFKSGFTLAEVLITLAIIGIVATLTIPALINSYRKTQMLSALKRAYSEFNQAIVLMTNDAGTPNDLVASGLFDSPPWQEGLFAKQITKYLKIIKICGLNNSLDSGCMSDNAGTNFKGTGDRYSEDGGNGGYYSFLTADGIAYKIYSYDFDTRKNCSVNDSKDGSLTKHVSQVCGVVIIDTNGPGGAPNNWGVDIFQFDITNGKGAMLYPPFSSEESTSWQTSNYCSDEKPETSITCAAKIMERGWQVTYF